MLPMKSYLPLLREARPPYRKVSRLYYVPVGLAYGLGLGSIAFGTSFWGGLMFLAIGLTLHSGLRSQERRD